MRALILGLVLAALFAAAAGGQQPPPAWVTIKGRVVLPDGIPVPARKAAVVPLNIPICPKKPILDERVIVDPETRGVKNVVVWLRPDSRDPRAALAANEVHPADARRPAKNRVIDQPCCFFEPHVLAVRVGDTLAVDNSSPVAHNFAWVSGSNGEFNQNIPAGGRFVFPWPLKAERAPIQYKCSVHPWMVGYVRVFDHPYYAVTDDRGEFEIRDAPAGKYRLVYWHENGFKDKAKGRFGDPVAIAAGKDGAPMLLDPTPFDVR